MKLMGEIGHREQLLQVAEASSSVIPHGLTLHLSPLLPDLQAILSTRYPGCPPRIKINQLV
jgi:hypothetical protein